MSAQSKRSGYAKFLPNECPPNQDPPSKSRASAPSPRRSPRSAWEEERGRAPRSLFFLIAPARTLSRGSPRRSGHRAKVARRTTRQSPSAAGGKREKREP